MGLSRKDPESIHTGLMIANVLLYKRANLIFFNPHEANGVNWCKYLKQKLINMVHTEHLIITSNHYFGHSLEMQYGNSVIPTVNTFDVL